MNARSHVAALNPDQRLAVTTTEGPVLVLAGAGTGKTRVITVRMAHLLDQRVEPEAILAMTFTNKAAREMRQRVEGLVGKRAAKLLTVGTFHSFCAMTLREHAEAIGLPKRFSICDAADQSSALRGVMRELHVADTTVKPSVALSRISLHKNRLESPDRAEAMASDDREGLIAAIYRRYDEHLRRSRSVDFDDLLIFTQRLLAEVSEVREAFQERFRYVMVDEYQDTNGPQYEVVRLISEGRENLCVVGDDDQSIYGWRGADISKILGFEKDYPAATVVRLQTNYRSTGHILTAANRVISNNSTRHEKSLHSGLGDGDHPVIHRLEDETEEAEWVAADIAYRLHSGGKPGDVAILFRTQVQPRPLETALRAAQLPYTLVGGLSYFDRKEVRDILAYIRLAANPSDEVSLLRIINRPARGIGKSSVDKVLVLATEEGIEARLAFDLALERGMLSKAAAGGWLELREIYDRVGGQEPGEALVQHISTLIDEVGYRTEVDRAYPDEGQRVDRWAAVMGVFDMAENYVSRAVKPTLTKFLERLTLASTDDQTAEDSDGRKSVTMMTLHAAKGLEFPTVYLVGAEEGLLPHQRSVDEDTVDEERRLMYVGITRAMHRLVLTYTAWRSRYGAKAETMPSRFLFEMTGEEPPEGWQACLGSEAKAAVGKRGGRKKAGKKSKGRGASAK
ncbi:MAG: DNA helicase-2/ATP-dependent DNA helicase PcrA [Pseudohongiellaceae bacterium]|jgi:DNA helicase-2/ATP-dependent DNA helicase PcrA